MKKIICVCGPTASGKTGAAAFIAKELGGEVVNADSVQIYRGLDIGSAMPREDEKLGVPHHLFGFAEPGFSFSAGRYQQAARAVIDDIHSRGLLPVMAGGTGLYIDAALYPMDFSGSEGGGELRRRLEVSARENGPEYMWRRLNEVDPGTAARLSANDAVRIIRALEVYESTGRTMSSMKTDYRSTPLYDALIIGLDTERSALYARIDRRVDMMMDAGLLDEARALYVRLGDGAADFKAIGYKELFRHFDGELSLAEAVELIKKNTRNYAKRQLTWFRRCPGITWFDALDPDVLRNIRACAVRWLGGDTEL